MADANVDITSLAAAKLYLAQASVALPTDPNLALLITAVSTQLQSWLNRRLPAQAYTIMLNGQGTDRLSLPNMPITAVSSLSIDGVSIPAAATPVASGYVFSDSQILLRGYCFTRGVQNVSIGYTGGYATIPADLVQACNEGLVAAIAALPRDPTARMEKAGDTAYEYGDIEAAGRVCLTANVTSILRQYRRVTPV